MKRATACTIFALALAGCFGPAAPTRPGVPAWVSQPPTSPGMLFAVGSGPERETALASARRELVAQVQLDIHAETDTTDTYAAHEATGNARVESLTSDARARVRTRAALSDLPGVTVDRQDTVDGTVYVLVTLDRRLWAAEVRGRLTAANEHLVALERDIATAPAESAADRLNVVGRLMRELIPALAERDEAERRLHLADPGCGPQAQPINRTKWLGRLATLLDQLQVRLPTGTPELDALAPALTEALAQVGLRATTVGEAPLLLHLTVTLRTQTIGEQVRCDGAVVGALGLTPAAGGRRLGGISLTDRAGSTQEATARERVLAKLAAKVAQNLADRLPGMLAGRPE